MMTHFRETMRLPVGELAAVIAAKLGMSGTVDVDSLHNRVR